MKVLTTVAEARAEGRSGRRVLVPTMGALHRGHLELIHVARDHAALGGEVVVSSFVNPLQFEPGSDFDRYPRLEKADEELCSSAGVDFLFRPWYGGNVFRRPLRSGRGDDPLRNSLRPIAARAFPRRLHGSGKTLQHFAPDIAIFGEKDFQQLAIVRRMVRDLNFPVQIIGVPNGTGRRRSGLELTQSLPQRAGTETGAHFAAGTCPRG